MAGKADWMACGLPIEGERANKSDIGQLAQRESPTCRLSDRLGDVLDRVRQAGWNSCAVVNDERVVLGLLKGKTLDAEPALTVEAVMESGPATLRPDTSVEQAKEYLTKQGMDAILVTTSDGKLIGTLQHQYLDHFLAGAGRAFSVV